MFVMANLARHLKIDPEAALRDANAKFTRRFRSIEATLAAEGRRPEDPKSRGDGRSLESGEGHGKAGMIRSFIGLPLPSGCTRALASLQAGLPVARTVPFDNMHLTLAFLGDQPQALLRGLCRDLGDLVVEPFVLRLAGLEVLGGKAPGAIAVKADGGEALDRLQAKVVRIVRGAGNRPRTAPISART